MSKAQSGLILIGIAIVMNVAGRLIPSPKPGGDNPAAAMLLSGIILALMFASVVIGLFGLYRLVGGLLTRK